MSRVLAGLYIAAADALSVGHYASATATLRQIAEDTIRWPSLSCEADRLAAALSHPLALAHPGTIRDLRMTAADLAEAARDES